MTYEAASPRASGAPADCFTVGLLAGAVEGDATKYFGSTLAFQHHVAIARSCGIVDEYLEPTAYGRGVYGRHGLTSLPPGRAYTWPPESIASVLAELNEEG